VTGIASVFTSFFQRKYRRIDPDNECVAALANLIRAELPQDMVSTYASPITPEEIHHAITTGGKIELRNVMGSALNFTRRLGH
jgi:hypothetical protein